MFVVPIFDKYKPNVIRSASQLARILRYNPSSLVALCVFCAPCSVFFCVRFFLRLFFMLDVCSSLLPAFWWIKMNILYTAAGTAMCGLYICSELWYGANTPMSAISLHNGGIDYNGETCLWHSHNALGNVLRTPAACRPYARLYARRHRVAGQLQPSVAAKICMKNFICN